MDKEKQYNVIFVADYFTMSVWIMSTSRTRAIGEATTVIQEHYGWNVAEVANEITAEKETD